MREELLARRFAGAECGTWLTNNRDGDQFGSGFSGVSPNSEIPALPDRGRPIAIRVFESGAILIHLA
jgi:GST-like protein